MKLSRTTLKTLRDIRRSRWQFLSVCLAIALGVAIFIGSYGSFQNLRRSYAGTYDHLSMADLWFDVGDAPSSASDQIRSLPGVAAAEGRLVEELPVTFPRLDSPHILGRLVSLPDGGARPSVNDVAVVDGRYVEDTSEVLLEQGFAKFNHVKVGDTMQVLAPDGRQLDLTVAGFVVSPEYLFAARNQQEMFSPPSQFGVGFLAYSTLAAFVGKQDRINDVAVRLGDGAQASAVASEVNDALADYGPGQVTDRDHQLSNRLLQLDLDGFRGLALVFPLLFLVVGGLASYTLLNRLMQSQRGQIGVMRAMGYSRGGVLRHYAGFGLTIGLVGACLGAIGGWLLAELVTHGYASSLNVPFVVV
ncbi:MAG: FtsX-like permease family protein, partial [Acidimicrobiia bacterium]